MATVADAAKLGDADRTRLAGSLYRVKAREYGLTIERLMAANGQKVVRLTLSPQIRRALTDEATDESRRIVLGFNDLVEGFTRRNGAKPTFPIDLQIWLRERARKRAPLIGRNATVTARLDAQIAFFRANGVEPLFDFTGPHPECPVCTALRATSPHKPEMVIAVGHPHLNCSHTWKARSVKSKLPKVLSIPTAVAGIVGLRPLVSRLLTQDDAAHHVRHLAEAGLGGAAAVEAYRERQGQARA